MKIAHLILAHSQPLQLERLIGRLDHPDAFFFIHLDDKCDSGPFRFLYGKPNCFLVRDRVKVSWGAYSIVQATINGFQDIASSGLKIDYVNLLSGSDYPLKSTDAIHSFLEASGGRNFMQYQLVYGEWEEAIGRLTEYHFTNYNFPGKYVLQNLAKKWMPKRKMPDNLVPVGRSQWMTITPDAVRYILHYLDSHREVIRFFKFTWAPDEIIFQTILYNSEFRNTLVNNNLRYTDWSAGQASPKTLTKADLDRMLASGALFARKFDMSKEPEVMDLLDETL
ncbi:beta-1,6-N-acetylglucosaminyltransferase [Dyadobacter sp. CY323]|uniref:beta-1,6-N-acetylglucosaminyltransferase n=1 Tax=Dyadobacter sp. CY323 TaxID=2907302 RepID=UPI001F38CDC9|nr:beta-1,6-N-acetylglucosaminyltransferase [Dyadobacter sp. CY323]MCE6987641.1 beta-1,6-N-acetylglucosaminyltransferase [Dyadobacter sp. CY323]